MSSLDDLLDEFDVTEARYEAIANATGTVAAIEAAVGQFLLTIWPKVQPYVAAGVDWVAAAAGGAVGGPVGALLGYVLGSFGQVGLGYAVRWLQAQLLP